MNTIETDPQQLHPEVNADFAILDLAQKDEGLLLGWLYRNFENSEIPWEPLYQGTSLADLWKKGPILVELKHSPAFREALIERYRSDYLGMLVHAPEINFEQLADHLRSIITIERKGKPAVFRFYDPRSLGPLFDVLDPAQRQSLLGPASRWTWHSYGQWQFVSSDIQQQVLSKGRVFAISEEQIAQLDSARLKQFGLFLADKYRAYIPSNDSDSFVLGEIESAQDAGISSHVDQERWLRAAIKLRGRLQDTPQWNQLMQGEGKTPLQALSQLEIEQGC